MRIKSLELCGFKSFKDKTTLNFSQGITGVVGPNGCGKSNIVDALLWVMGETSPKQMRGSSMVDVIFTGAESFPSMGVAEVSLILENTGGVFPSKYFHCSEIMLTRRVYRSGESEYLINKEIVRLKDIQDIFIDTGAGAKGFSIIEQGSIGQILIAKPEERRLLIEEVAGITKFRARQKESRKKLLLTEQNLVRIQDILSEKTKQMKRLERQVKKAEDYKKVKENLKEKELFILSNQFRDFDQELSEKKELLKKTQEEEESLSTSLHKLESEKQSLKFDLSKKEDQMKEVQEIQKKNQDSFKEKEDHIHKLHLEVQGINHKKEALLSSMGEHKELQKKMTEDLKEENKKLESVTSRFEELEMLYENKMSSYQKSQEFIIETESHLIQKRNELLQVSQKKSQVEVEIQSLEAQIEEQKKRENSSKKVLIELEEKEKEYAKKMMNASLGLKKEMESQSQFLKDMSLERDLLKKMEEKKNQHEEKLGVTKKELTQVSERLQTLKELQANFEGFQEGTQHLLMKQKKKKENFFSPLADLIEVPKEYELAMEAALGEDLQLLFMIGEKTLASSLSSEATMPSSVESSSSSSGFSSEDQGDSSRGEISSHIKELLKELKKNQKGRSSFFFKGKKDAQKSVQEEMKEEKPKEEIHEEGKNLLSSFHSLEKIVQFSDKLSSESRKFISSFLSRVFVLNSLEEAFSMREKFGDLNFVTLEGDFLKASGIITGGGVPGKGSDLLRRRNLISELSSKKESLNQSLSHLEEVYHHSLKKVEVSKNKIEEIKETQNRQNILIAELTKDQERIKSEKENINLAHKKQEKEISYYESQVKEFNLKLESLKEKFKKISNKKELLRDKEVALDQDLKNLREESEALQSEVTQLQVESATKEQEKESIQLQIKKLNQSLKDLESKEVENQKEWKENESLRVQSEKELEEHQKELEKLVMLMQEKEKELSHFQEEFEIISKEIQTLEAEFSKTYQKSHQVKAQSSEIHLNTEELKLKIEHIQNQGSEKYGVKLDEIAKDVLSSDAFAGASLDEVKKDFLKLEKRLQSFDDVYLMAIEEYKELKGTSDFLSSQYDELVKAKDELHRVIEHIHRICSRRFKESFNEVNQKFSHVFPILFGGGSAELLLLEGEKKEDFGIDIVARPPGKKLKNIKLLSGGEKALTALSLIFSLFLLKPSPFCILDEVDAPLDDANVFRFNALIKEMARSSQVILVTHNKYTMKISDFLFGVTMEKKGVSKMASVKLNENTLLETTEKTIGKVVEEISEETSKDFIEESEDLVENAETERFKM